MEIEDISKAEEILCDDGKGYKTFVKDDHLESDLLKCYQHVGREYCYVFYFGRLLLPNFGIDF